MVCWYGVPPEEAADTRKIGVPFQGHFALEDSSFPPEKVDALEDRLREGGVEKDVTFVAADHDIDDQIDAAYRARYRRYSASLFNYMVRPEAPSTTIRLMPRSASP